MAMASVEERLETESGLKHLYHRVTDRYPAIGALRTSRWIFGNGLPLSVNMRYWTYWMNCRQAFSGSTQAWQEPQVRSMVRQLRTQGYCIFEPPADMSTTRQTAERVRQLVDAGVVSITPGHEEWMIQIPESVRNVPGMFDLLRPEVVSTIEGYFGGWFKIFCTEIYRLVPTTERMQTSGLWHTDNYPPGMLKAMVYLTDCTKMTGALRVHPRPQTRRLLQHGFFDRHRAQRFAETLAKECIVLEAKAGSVVLWDSNLVHRGTPPERGLRDAVSIKFLPSREPWKQHLAHVGEGVTYERRAPFPKDPAED